MTEETKILETIILHLENLKDYHQGKFDMSMKDYIDFIKEDVEYVKKHLEEKKEKPKRFYYKYRVVKSNKNYQMETLDATGWEFINAFIPNNGTTEIQYLFRLKIEVEDNE